MKDNQTTVERLRAEVERLRAGNQKLRELLARAAALLKE